MITRFRLIVAAALLILLMLGPMLAAALLVWLDLPPEGRQAMDETLAPRLPLAVMVLLFGLFLGGMLLRALLRQYVGAPLAMAEQMRLMLGANRTFRLRIEGPAEAQALARAANDLADQRDALLADVEAQVVAARAAVEAERNRLAALISDLPQPVLVCNLDGRILLYNNRARLQARALVPDGQANLVGLGRSIFAIFDRALIQHALDTLQGKLERAGSQPLAHFVTVSQRGQFIRVQLAPVLASDSRDITGYVLTLENISRYLETDNDCDLLMRELVEHSRASLATVRGALRHLPQSSEAGAEAAVIAQEVERLAARLAVSDQRYAEAMRARWPLEEMLAADLLIAVVRRIEHRSAARVRLDDVPEGLWVKVDSYSLTQALSFLAGRLHEDYGVRRFALRATVEGERVALALLWTGTAISTEILMAWQLEAMSDGGESSPLTLRDVTDRHGGEFFSGRDTASQQSLLSIRLPLAAVQDGEGVATPQIESRPEFYDFDLFHRSGEDHALDDRPLRTLAYTVFDTETTGLEPSAGDEIIQIGAVRIVNGRLLRHENMDQLVDPRRPLKPESIPIHGIREEMLRGQPTIDTVLPAFHRFCEDTVLVAHNAAFDMRFLQLKEQSTGVRFTQPVLDTLLLSAVVHPNQESHKLEAIAERLGLPIIGRHNALGDAIVTAEVFLRLLPLLEDMGIHTLGQAQAAAQKTRFAKVSY